MNKSPCSNTLLETAANLKTPFLPFFLKAVSMPFSLQMSEQSSVVP